MEHLSLDTASKCIIYVFFSISQEYDGDNLMDMPKMAKPSKFAICVASKLWTEDEFIEGIIEPGNSKHFRVILSGVKLEQLKSK